MDQLLGLTKHLMNEEFDSLLDSRQRVDYAMKKFESIEDLRKKFHKLLTKHKNKNMKSLSNSQEYRQKGNYFFEMKNFEFALYWYNLSVMSAPFPANTGSESDRELSYAYSSRCLTFFEMKLYSNALFDIDCALNYSLYSMVFSNRLELMFLKIQILSQMRRYVQSIEFIEEMIDLIPCLPINNPLVRALIRIRVFLCDQISDDVKDNQMDSDCDLIQKHCKAIDHYFNEDLEVSQTESKGRHYMAKEDIPAKNIILVEKSFACVLFKGFFKTHCQTCFKNVGYKYQPCSQCCQVVFCDEECFQNACHHTYECGIVDIFNDFANHYILFRIIQSVGPQMAIHLEKQTQQRMQSSDDLKPIQSDYLKFIALKDHRESYCLKTKALSTYRSIHLALIIDYFHDLKHKNEVLVEYLSELSTLLDVLNYKALVNCFGMSEPMTDTRAYRGEHIGNAICLKSSFFNHSCSPNSIWQFNGQHISVLTVQEVKKGQELNICYGPYSWSQPFEERQEFLKKRYFFDCKCNACLDKQMPNV